MTSQEFQAQTEAEAAFDADSLDLGKLAALQAAETVYFAALRALSAKWDAVEEGQLKDSAEVNAWDTISEQATPEADKVQWLRFALGSLDR